MEESDCDVEVGESQGVYRNFIISVKSYGPTGIDLDVWSEQAQQSLGR